jgi:pimeloyl-ACP methyl ester carboxylesterase
VQSQVDQLPSLTDRKAEQDADPSAIALIMMPFLGGSREEWAEVIDALSPKTRCIGLDLPGFGDAAETKGYSVADMAAYVIDRVKSLKLRRFMLVGHSMAGKVAMVVASQAKTRPELCGLSGLVLVASSPPSPEPMSEDKRTEMKANLGKPGVNYRKHAEDFIRENASGELPPHVLQRAVSDVLRMNCQAWTAWLDSGSKEDWSERVADLDVHSLVVAGEDDEALGPQIQERFVMPRLLNSQLCVVSGAGHLIPMERPLQLAKLIAEFVNRVTPAARTMSHERT